MTALNPAAVAHAERCPGVPVLTQDGVGQWIAECSVYHPELCGWEVSGCESRAEAGATFYGHDPRGEQ